VLDCTPQRVRIARGIGVMRDTAVARFICFSHSVTAAGLHCRGFGVPERSQPTARIRGWILVTRNVAGLARSDVRVLNPVDGR